MSAARNNSKSKLKLAFLINIVSPYRVPLLQYLGERFHLLVMLAGLEDNRNWTQDRVPGVDTRVVFGWTLRGASRTDEGATAEQRYLHLSPGYVPELLRFRPDAIVSTEMGLRSLIAIAHGHVFRVPVWIWWEGGAHSTRMHGHTKLRRGVRRTVFAKLVKHWICFGSHSADYIHSLGVDSGRIRQLQLPADDRMFRAVTASYQLQSSRPRALFVGRLIQNKGIRQLMEATEQLQREGHEFSLIVVGDGPEADWMRRQAIERSLRNVEWIPWVAPERMPEIYKACDFLIFPTLDDVWGLVVNEAIISGIPVIASKYAGCTTDLLPEQNTFDPLNAKSLLDAYRRAILGQIPLTSATSLQSIDEIARIIVHDILEELS